MRVRRFAVLAPTVLGLAVATPALAQDPPPRTGFEQRVAATPSGAEPVPWTTLDEEAALLAAVDASTDRVAVEEVGRSAQGRPLLLARVGEPAPPGPDAAAEGRVVLFTCSQHGDEPAGREGCLQRLRDLAYSSDPAVAEHLRTATVLFLSANPDGRAADTRENAQGIDVNRDHLDPVSPEGQLIERLIRDWRPDVVADMHEFSSRPLYDPELLFLWPRNRNVDERVRELSVALSRDYVAAGAEAAGFSTGVYGISVLDGVEVAQDAGDEDERILRNVAGLRGSVGLLVETDTSANRRNPEEAGDRVAVQRRRVATHVQAIGDVLRFQREQAPEIEATTEAAGARHAARSGPFYLDGADNRLPSIDDVLYPPPCAYDVTATEAGRLASTFALHGIRSEPRGGDVRVPLAQPAQPLIPLLLDAAAEFAPATSGRRVASCG